MKRTRALVLTILICCLLVDRSPVRILPIPQTNALAQENDEGGEQQEPEQFTWARTEPTPEQKKAMARRFNAISQLAGEMTLEKLKGIEDRDRYLALGMLKVEKAQLWALYAQNDAYYLDDLNRELDAAEAIFKSLAQGKPADMRARGKIERAYIAESDRSAQPYWLFVPESFKPERPAGLLVFLHGYDPDLNKADWFDSMFCPELEGIAHDLNYIILLPYARSNTDFQGIGEDDVIHAIELAQKEFPIDPDRIVLSGGSMGGMGALTIAAHYPDIFAGVVPISARADFYLWKNIDPASLSPWKRIQMDLEFAKPLAVNLQTEMLFFHGAQDFVVQPLQSRSMNGMLQQMRYPSRLIMLPDSDHWCWSDVFLHAELRAWLAGVRRKRYPTRVSYKTYHLKFNRAYWASIEGMESWAKEATLDAHWQVKNPSAAGARPRLLVDTSNVTRLELLLPRKLCRDAKTVTVVWNGETKDYDIPAGRRISLASEDAAPEGALRKTPAQPGRIREAYARPFVIVYGTQDGTDRDKKAALQAARDWILFAQGDPPFMPDSRITTQHAEHFNLILFGTPRSNSVIAGIADKLPIKFDNEDYVIGQRRYDGKTYGLSFTYPNPLAPNRVVVVNSGMVWGKDLPRNHKFDFLPDFIVFTDEKSEDGTECNKSVCAGYFDGQWRLSKESTWVSEEPE